MVKPEPNSTWRRNVQSGDLTIAWVRVVLACDSVHGEDYVTYGVPLRSRDKARKGSLQIQRVTLAARLKWAAKAEETKEV